MSTHIKILSQKEINSFDNPPEFNAEERKKFFLGHVWIKNVLEGFRTPSNKVGFILQLGYFRSANKFFSVKTFHQKDINFAIRRLALPVEKDYLKDYHERTFERHQKIILKNLVA